MNIIPVLIWPLFHQSQDFLRGVQAYHWVAGMNGQSCDLRYHTQIDRQIVCQIVRQIDSLKNRQIEMFLRGVQACHLVAGRNGQSCDLRFHTQIDRQLNSQIDSKIVRGFERQKDRNVSEGCSSMSLGSREEWVEL